MRRGVVVIAMAGSGRRFAEQGYALPKYAIEVSGRPLIEWALLSLVEFFSWSFVFAGPESTHAKSLVRQVTEKLGIAKAQYVSIPYRTRGQAHTVQLTLQALNLQDTPLLIYNVDTHVKPGILRAADIAGAGWIPVFVADGLQWSFAKCTKDWRVSRTAEKERISPFATVGLYYFSSSTTFVDNALRHEIERRESEAFVAPVYNELIETGAFVTATLVPASNVIPLGTPEDVRLCEQMGFLGYLREPQ
jgi:dTDP-glucose pyrophosphorylase